MTDADLELWARLVVLQACLQRDPFMRFSQILDQPTGSEVARKYIVETAKGLLPPEIPNSDRDKLRGKIERTTAQMLEGIVPRLR